MLKKQKEIGRREKSNSMILVKLENYNKETMNQLIYFEYEHKAHVFVFVIGVSRASIRNYLIEEEEEEDK